MNDCYWLAEVELKTEDFDANILSSSNTLAYNIYYHQYTSKLRKHTRDCQRPTKGHSTEVDGKNRWGILKRERKNMGKEGQSQMVSQRKWIPNICPSIWLRRDELSMLGVGLMHNSRRSWEGQWEWCIARKTLEQGDKNNRSWATSGCRCSRDYHRHGVTADGKAGKCAVKIF